MTEGGGWKVQAAPPSRDDGPLGRRVPASPVQGQRDRKRRGPCVHGLLPRAPPVTGLPAGRVLQPLGHVSRPASGTAAAGIHSKAKEVTTRTFHSAPARKQDMLKWESLRLSKKLAQYLSSLGGQVEP